MKLEINPSERHNQTDKKMKNPTKPQKQEQEILNITFIIILFTLFIIIIPKTQATPQIQLISQTSPLEHGSIQILMLNITTNNTNATTNTTITQALIEFDQQNHTLQKETEHYEYSWIPQQTGTNTYIIYATDSINETQTYNNSFLVIDTTPPEITETQPKGTLNYNLIELKAITNENSTCKYDPANVSYDSMYFTLSGGGLAHTQLRSFGDGAYTFYLRCKDAHNNIAQSKIISFTIDTNPPAILSITPTGTVNQQEIELRLNTDETATCKWGKTNQEFEYLDNLFHTTGATLHEQPLILIEGINTYYVICKDSTGNKNSPITLNIELNLPPTANINIEKNNTYKAITQGTYKISLTTSEHLIQEPSLKLKHGNGLINIPLEGSQEYWTGYLIIPTDEGEDVGEFLYTGTDTKGTTGTEITNGKLILIDTIPPPTPTALKLINEDNKIKLSWDYAGEEPNHFNIYQSTTGKTDKSNFETSTTEKTYKDTAVTNKIGYFYRISAVDKAGNEGQLTEEEFIMTEFQNTTSQPKQDPELLAIINEKIGELDRIVQDLEVKTATLEKATDQDLLQIINEKQLVEKQKEIKSKIQIIIGELKTYREIKLTKGELNTKIGIINAKLEEYKKDIIKEVKVISKIQNEQIAEEALIQETINEYLKNKALTGEQKKEYYLRTKDLQQKVRITQELISYEIAYDYKESEKIILIKESLISAQDIKGALIQEYMPSDLVKVSKITFTTIPKDLNRLGAQWLLKDLAKPEIRYIINEEKELSQLQRIRTILLYEIDEFLSGLSEEKSNASDQATGKAVSAGKQGFSLTKAVFIPIGVVLILILLIYYFVFLKTESVYDNKAVTTPNEEATLKHTNISREASAIHAYTNNKIQISKSSQNMNQIITHIQQAYEKLESEDIDAASIIYSLAFSHYERSNLNFKDRIKANFEMNTLREKIIDLKKPKHLYT
jgi:hypothetical protein